MVFAGGGTGGHLFPGLAVAEALVERGEGEAVFVGGTQGIEARAVPAAGFPFHAVDIRGVRGRGWRGWLGLGWRLPAAVARCMRLLRELQPDVAVGLGGYASFPAVLAARILGIPVVLLEQNARPGLANRVLARFADRVCTALPGASAGFPRHKVRLTGNPVRPLRRSGAAERGEGFTLLVFGGSQGARRINDAVTEAAPELARRVPGLRIVHQTGRADAARVRQSYERRGVRAEVHEFIDDMAKAYAEADLVVCRAGAGTVAELAAVGRPAILVPYPHAVDDHQTANAEVLRRAGAAIVVPDADLTPERLVQLVSELCADPQRRARMEEAAHSAAVPDAAQRVLAVCRELVEARGGGP